MDQRSAKICAICGRDCSHDPRIKDPKGRYFHRRCYEQAARAQRHDEAPPPVADAPPEPDSIAVEPPSPDPFGHDEPTLDPTPPIATSSQPEQYTDGFAIESDSQSELPPEAIYQTAHTTDFACPGCGAAMGPGAIICTSCGFNTKTGTQVGTEAGGSEHRRAGEAGRIWPAVIGIISIVLGAIGALLYFSSLLVDLLAGSSANGGTQAAGASTGRTIGTLLPLILCLWLLISGLGIIRRRQSAMVSIRRWAIAKIIIFAAFFTCLFAGLFISASAIESLDAEFGGALGGMGIAFIAILLVVLLAWFLAWPVFILIWFGRDRIQQEVAQWH